MTTFADYRLPGFYMFGPSLRLKMSADRQHVLCSELLSTGIEDTLVGLFQLLGTDRIIERLLLTASSDITRFSMQGVN